MISFAGTLDRALYIKALRLHGTSAQWLGILLFAIGCWGLIGGINAGTPKWGMPLFVAVLGAYIVASPYIAARQAFRTNALLHSAFTGYADATEFVAESSHGRNNIAWSMFYKARVAPDMVLLYISARQFHILVRRFFQTDSDWSEFQSLVRANVKSKQSGLSPVKAALLWIAIIVAIFFVWAFLRAAR